MGWAGAAERTKLEDPATLIVQQKLEDLVVFGSRLRGYLSGGHAVVGFMRSPVRAELYADVLQTTLVKLSRLAMNSLFHNASSNRA